MYGFNAVLPGSLVTASVDEVPFTLALWRSVVAKSLSICCIIDNAVFAVRLGLC